MIRNEASGYLIKSVSAEEIAEAIQTALEGKLYLNIAMEHVMHSSPSKEGALPAITKREKKCSNLFPRID